MNAQYIAHNITHDMLCDKQFDRLRWTWPIYIFYTCQDENEIISHFAKKGDEVTGKFTAELFAK